VTITKPCFVLLAIVMALLGSSDLVAEPVVIKSGNVIETPERGNMPHHMLQTQHDFAKLVAIETNGEVDLRILEGKRDDIPVFGMPKMTIEGSTIQACAVPSFFLPRVPELQVFEIPYLFRDRAHAARYPTSELAIEFTALIEERYPVKVLGHFLVAYNVAITSTDKAIQLPEDFAGRYVNDDFESFAPMWANIRPAERFSIGYMEAAGGALHTNKLLDTSIGMLQNIYVQKQYTKFNYATIAPSFYTFYYTFILNRNIWDELSDAQQSGIMRAAQAIQRSAFDNERATAIYHTALNRSLGMNIHIQTADERAEWESEFSNKVRDGILQESGNADKLRTYIDAIRNL
jgi:TRAP-type C4-dicarboxylate transport system substrate-binding protein